jgi:hypothetical protein
MIISSFPTAESESTSTTIVHQNEVRKLLNLSAWRSCNLPDLAGESLDVRKASAIGTNSVKHEAYLR